MSYIASGSSAGDINACPARAAFSQAKTTGSYAIRGTAIHLFLRNVTLFPQNRDEFLKEVPEEYRATCASINIADCLDQVDTVGGCEVSYALNVKTQSCRYIGTNIDRDYDGYLAETHQPPLDTYEIPFTTDLVGKVLSDTVHFEQDYKTGRYVGDPFEHFQRKISAAGIMFFHDVPSAISRIAYIWDDGTVKLDGCEFTIFDAMETCDVMVKAIDNVIAARKLLAEGGTPTVYPDADAQCKYCAAFTVCPYWNNLLWGAKAGLLQYGIAVEDIPKGKDKDKEYAAAVVNALSSEVKGQAMAYVKDVLKVAELFEDQLKEHAKREPLPVDGGYAFAPKEVQGRSYFDASEARGLIFTLASRLGEDEEEIQRRLAKLNKQGSSYVEVRKRKIA